MAIHSSILAWRIPWTKKPGRGAGSYSPWDCKESDTTDRLTDTHTHTGECRGESMLGAECNLYGVRVNKLCEGQVQLQSFVAAAAAVAKSLESCPTLCDPIDGSPPGSPVPGTLQARTLEWVAISFSNA